MKLIITIQSEAMANTIKDSLKTFSEKTNRCRSVNRINEKYPILNVQGIDYESKRSVVLEEVTDRCMVTIRGVGILEFKQDSTGATLRVTNLLPKDLSLYREFSEIVILGIDQLSISCQLRNYIKMEAEWNSQRLAFIASRAALFETESELLSVYGDQCIDFQLPKHQV